MRIESIDFVVYSVLMKLNIEIINECTNFVGIELLSVYSVKCFEKFSCNVIPLIY